MIYVLLENLNGIKTGVFSDASSWRGGSLYRQIIDKGGIPFSLTIRKDDNFGYTDEELNAKLEHSYQQVLRREGAPMNEVFDRLERKYADAGV